CRIVDRSRGPGHVARTDGGGRHSHNLRRELAVELAVITAEIEELVLDDRAAEGAAGGVVDVLWLALSGREKERVGLQGTDLVVAESRPVELVGSAFQLHIDRCAAGKALVRVQARGGNGNGFDRLQ